MLQKRELEKNILAGIDRLVHLLIELSCTDGKQKDRLLEEAIQTVRKVTPLLLVLLGGKEEHLENLLRQLISQKLPHSLALDSFGPLKRDLDTILTLAFFSEPAEVVEHNPAVNSPDVVPEEIPATTDAPPEEITANSSPEIVPAGVNEQKPAPNLAVILQRIFPSAAIQQGYQFRSLFLDYYLPEKSLAILILYPGVRTIPVIEQLLKKEGITLVKLQPSDLAQPGLIASKLARIR